MMVRIPSHLHKYVWIEEITGKLVVSDDLPKEHEFEVKLLKKNFDKIYTQFNIAEID